MLPTTPGNFAEVSTPGKTCQIEHRPWTSIGGLVECLKYFFFIIPFFNECVCNIVTMFVFLCVCSFVCLFGCLFRRILQQIDSHMIYTYMFCSIIYIYFFCSYTYIHGMNSGSLTPSWSSTVIGWNEVQELLGDWSTREWQEYPDVSSHHGAPGMVLRRDG